MTGLVGYGGKGDQRTVEKVLRDMGFEMVEEGKHGYRVWMMKGQRRATP